MATHTAMSQGNSPELRQALERSVGIVHFVVRKDTPWGGILRKRWTDFQVHEVSQDGTVVHLQDFSFNGKEYDQKEAAKSALSAKQELPKGAPTPVTKTSTMENPSKLHQGAKSEPHEPQQLQDGTISEADVTLLEGLLDKASTDALIVLHNKILEVPKSGVKDCGSVLFPEIERPQRTRVHQEVRRIFSSKIETVTNPKGRIQAKAASRSNRWRAAPAGDGFQRSNNKRPPKFLHFTLYKENRDTMDAIAHIARVMKMPTQYFSTAGTKDKRAVTAQRVSIRYRNPKTLLMINNKVFNVKIGDFSGHDHDVYLGGHGGNEFTIVMKDCTFAGTESMTFDARLAIARSTTTAALQGVIEKGFINYFGTQRFGTFAIGTQVIGKKILQGDFAGAVKDLLSYDPELLSDQPSSPGGEHFVRHDDIARARALAKYDETGNLEAALADMPRKWKNDIAMLQHLHQSPTDYIGALMKIPRGMRSMYLHAYQSLVWNNVVNKRWELSGSVLKGDLVLPKTANTTSTPAEIQQLDEEEIHLSEANQHTGASRQEVLVLSEDDVLSGRYTIHDIVLPLPGHSVVYPDNEAGKFYSDFMGKEENGSLDPRQMQRTQHDFSLPGDYRKMMGRFHEACKPTASAEEYCDDTAQLVPTDMDLILKKQAVEKEQRVRPHPGKRSPTTTHDQPRVPEVNPQAAGWHAFAQNVVADEHKEALASSQRRKASQEDIKSPRFNDTWKETSVDGTNKRIKVATHELTMSASDEPATYIKKETTEGKLGGDLQNAGPVTNEYMQAATDQHKELSEESWTTAPTDQPDKDPEKISEDIDMSQDIHDDQTNGPPKPSQTRIKVEEGLYNSTSELKNKSSNELAAGMDDQSNGLPDKAMQNGEGKTVAPVSEVPDAERKIAVIFKFALHSSQYATIVVRELQG